MKSYTEIMTIISMKQASEILNVSVATVRNWIKHDYLKPLYNSKNKFLDSDVNTLKQQIESGQIDRLRKRANKQKSSCSFIPDEYLDNVTFVHEVKKIRDLFLSKNLDLETSIFVLVLKQLVLSKEVVFLQSKNILKLESYTNWKRNCVKEELHSWNEELKVNVNSNIDAYRDLFDVLTDKNHDDTLGVIYQSLLLEGSKSKQGSYYTPKIIVDSIFNTFDKGIGKYLDPCCGTGQFIIGAIRSGYSNPEYLYGFDLDTIAVKIARVNLLLAFKKKEFKPQIYNLNTLTDTVKYSYQLIATNPPWGSTLNVDENKKCNSMFPYITSGESFSFFLAKSIQLAGKKGCISFILPESILNIKIHSDIREYILKNTTIKAVYNLGKKFKGVFTPVIRLDILNEYAPAGWLIDIFFKNNKKYQIPQSRFKDNDNFVFDVSISNDEFQILELLYKEEYITLKNNADWALGIVTGDNKKFISNSQNKGMEPIYKGSNIEKYRLKLPDSFICYKPERFQQVAPENKYRASEKLIYKFISNKLIFAYDTSGALTLNSANILLPKFDNYPIKLILGLLNSKLYQFMFFKKFNSLKVLKGDLEKIPFPEISKEKKDKIISFVELAIKGIDVHKELDIEIMNIFKLSSKQINIVMNYDIRQP
ncbi:N-6 DNA methylase [bacterium]|nr:N-6 DNA methylase [bacterium]